LSWFVEHNIGIISEYDLIVIIDADTQLSSDFCTAIRNIFQSGTICVAQSSVEPINEQGMAVTTLAAYSEILSQRVDDYARSVLGWSVPLRGTGMVFTRDVFLQVCSRLKTQVDDIELSLYLAELNISVVHCPELKILDPKSTSILGLARQRGRWLKGQREIWHDWHNKLIYLRSVSNWALLHGLLLKPKTALVLIKIILLSIFLLFQGDLMAGFCGVALFSLLVDLVYYVTGLKYVSEPRKYLSSFFSAPLFLLMWSFAWLFSFNKDTWLRSRE
jgi:cellulose synthase/poly-beta-1,6-N-acetylglucosamine synthase-like glycosyltransferase